IVADKTKHFQIRFIRVHPRLILLFDGTFPGALFPIGVVMKRSTPAFLIVLALSIVLCIGSAHSSASDRPALRPAPALLSAAGLPTKDGAPEISQAAWSQIQALLDEKQSRSAAQQKIDSQLLYATKLHRGERIAAGVQTL